MLLKDQVTEMIYDHFLSSPSHC